VNRPITFNNAELSEAGRGTIFDPVTFVVRGTTAYASDRRGYRVWEAEIVDYDRPTNDTVVLHLLDGPDVTARRYCRPCSQRH